MLACKVMLENELNTPEGPFAEVLERYLGETLHDLIHVRELATARSFPSFLGRTYRFYEASIAGRRCVFLATLDHVATPASIAKHVSLVRAAVDAIVIFATPSLTAHNRSRLIGQGVPFAVPGNQLYIPELAMDLREHFRQLRPRRVEALSPAAQAVLFQHLLRRDDKAATPSVIAVRLHYSAMSIGRAFDELVAAGLAQTDKNGKERLIRFKMEGRQLFEAARDFLRSPVRAVKFIRGDYIDATFKRAGETALAELTALSQPPLPTFAVAASDWKVVAQTSGFIETSPDQADCIVETWSYNPAALSDGCIVDLLSLYVQFRHHRDERVSTAAEQLLVTIPW